MRPPIWIAAALLAGVAAAACAPTATDGPAREADGAPAPATRSEPPKTTATAGNQLVPQTESSASPSASATVDPDAKVIYLTFDDGPWVPYTEQILKVLADHDATATFFVVGEMAVQHKGLLAKIKAGGHAIGNHTWSHPQLTTLSDQEVRSELDRTTRAVGADRMGACMRPPYGDVNDRVRAIAKERGFKSVLWTDWAEDWLQPPIPKFLNSLKQATKDKANILLHDGGGDRPNTVKAVRIMLPRWEKQGYTFQALPQCTKPLTSAG